MHAARGGLLLHAQHSCDYTAVLRLQILVRVRRFESFLANKYAAAKRFGLEGCETLIPGMKALIDHAADLGVETVCMGMPHRGGCSSAASDKARPYNSSCACARA